MVHCSSYFFVSGIVPEREPQGLGHIGENNGLVLMSILTTKRSEARAGERAGVGSITLRVFEPYGFRTELGGGGERGGGGCVFARVRFVSYVSIYLIDYVCPSFFFSR